MKITTIVFSILFFLIIPFADAKPKITTNIEKIAEHKLIVTLSWKVTVNSDKTWDACDLIISFQDKKEQEIYEIRETLKLKIGDNHFSGHEVCHKEIWDRIDKYVTTLNCVFR